MPEPLDPLRILADAMNYLDRGYCRGSIVDWVRTSPEGAAYSIVRQLFVDLVEEAGGYGHALQAA
jgi:hypothetical protein